MLTTTIAQLGFICMLVGFLWIPVIFIVTIITPKKLVDKYLKEPHFSAGEIIAYKSFPTFFMRTAIFCRFYLTPSAVKGRKLHGFVEDSPKWYRISVMTSLAGLIVSEAIFLISGVIVYLMT